MVDATCTPADISYPTDLKLLNAAREKLEKIIDVTHEPLKGEQKKVRTYRQRARKEYLKVAKKRHPSKKKIRTGIRKQLQYIARNLRHIEKMAEAGGYGRENPLMLTGGQLYKDLLVISELYRQQKQMFDQKSHKVADRIVSISQPYVRPIVRGKANADVEFGAKISVAMVEGYAFLEKLSWDAYNEAGDLKDHIENYHKRFGYYPESVHVDHIYRNAETKLEPITYKPIGHENEWVSKFVDHNQAIEAARRLAGGTLGQLVAGTKKDIVLSNLIADPSRTHHVVIYGWHRLDGDPIQPVTNIHIDTYVDYSHGVRLMSPNVTIDDQAKDMATVLSDPVLYKVLSDETGPMMRARYGTD